MGGEKGREREEFFFLQYDECRTCRIQNFHSHPILLRASLRSLLTSLQSKRLCPVTNFFHCYARLIPFKPDRPFGLQRCFVADRPLLLDLSLQVQIGEELGLRKIQKGD